MTASTARRTRITAAMLALSLSASPFSLLSGSAAADSATASARLKELQAQREKVRTEKASSASSVDALKSTDAEVKSALATLRSNVASEAALLEEAERAATEADAREQTALAAEAQAAAELTDLNDAIREHAREEFARGTDSDDPLQLLAESDLTDASRKRTYRSVATLKNVDTTERYRTIQANLLSAREDAEAASAAAATHRGEVTNRLAKLEEAQLAQEKYADELESRIDRALIEAQGLESIDSALAGQITAQQAELGKQLQAEREAAAAARARSAGSRSSNQAGSTTPIPTDVVGSDVIVSVGGIRVHRDIASNVAALLDAAAADGINFTGGGYRDPAGQIAVRRSNCGSSDYAIYQMPASSCSPPTARPGQSMHERGMAIDFQQNGRSLTRGSSGFAWLKANASRFGLQNLPSEPWHWSTNGN